MESSIDQAEKNLENWETSGDKEKYPHIYMFDRLNEYLNEALGVPVPAQCKLSHLYDPYF